MALPVTIAGVAFPANHWNVGPFKSSGGNYYIVFLDSGDLSIVEMWKATDPTSAFSEVDSADKPDLTNVAGSMWALQISDVLHIATQETTTGRVGYHTFDMATDEWGTVNEAVHTPANDPTNSACSIDLRADGDIVISHMAATDTIAVTAYRRVAYSRKEVGSWTTNVSFCDNAATDDFTGPMVIIDSSDRSHFVWRNDDIDDGLHRTLNSSNTLDGTTTTYDAAADPAEETMTSPLLIYTRSGSETLAFAYLNASSQPNLAYGTVGDTITFSTEAISAVAVDRPNVTAQIVLATLNNKLHLLYVDDTSNDLFYDTDNGGSWTTDIEVLDAVNVLRLSGNIYDRAGNYKFAFAYLNGATITYNEYDLGAVPAGQPTSLRAATVPFMRAWQPQRIGR